MTTHAVGIYLYLVRDVVQKLRLADVAATITTATGMQITALEVRRIERGEPTTVAILHAFVDAIDADRRDATTLLEAEAPADATIGAMVRAVSNRRDRVQPIAQRRSV